MKTKRIVAIALCVAAASTVGCIKKKKKEDKPVAEQVENKEDMIRASDVQRLIQEALDAQKAAQAEAAVAARKAVEPKTEEERKEIEKTIEKLNLEAASVQEAFSKFQSAIVGVPEKDLPSVYDAFIKGLATNASYVQPLIDGYYYIQHLNTRSRMNADQLALGGVDLANQPFAVIFADELYRSSSHLSEQTINALAIAAAKTVDTSASYYNSGFKTANSIGSSISSTANSIYTTVSSYWNEYWSSFSRFYGL